MAGRHAGQHRGAGVYSRATSTPCHFSCTYPTHRYCFEPAAPGERTLPDGLSYRDDRVGKGPATREQDFVYVEYTGTLVDGTKFDSSYDRLDPHMKPRPLKLKLGMHSVIRGWEEGISGMRAGGKRHLVIPPYLAYGHSAVGGVIPPNSTLVFDVELVRIEAPPSPVDLKGPF